MCDRLKARIFSNLGNQRHVIKVLAIQLLLRGVESGEVDDFANQLIQTFSFALNAIMFAFQISTVTARQPQCETHACQRCAQLMRYIAQQHFFGINEAAQSICHLIEVLCQHTQLIMARGELIADTRIKIAIGQGARAFLQTTHRPRHAARQVPADDAADGQRQQQHAELKHRRTQYRQLHIAHGRKVQRVYRARLVGDLWRTAKWITTRSTRSRRSTQQAVASHAHHAPLQPRRHRWSLQGLFTFRIHHKYI